MGGNHEMILDEIGATECKTVFSGYIEDELVEFEGLRIYGSPLSRPYKHAGENTNTDTEPYTARRTYTHTQTHRDTNRQTRITQNENTNRNTRTPRHRDAETL